jgi:hypothetical protein
LGLIVYATQRSDLLDMPFGNIDANTAVAVFSGILIVVLAANASASLVPTLSISRRYARCGGNCRHFWDDACYSCVSRSFVPLAISLCCRIVLQLVNASFPLLNGGTGGISPVDEAVDRPGRVIVGGNKLRCQCDWRNAKPATHLSAHW